MHQLGTNLSILRDYADLRKYHELAEDGAMLFWRNHNEKPIFCLYEKRKGLWQSDEEDRIIPLVKRCGLYEAYLTTKKRFFAYKQAGIENKAMYDFLCCVSNTKANDMSYFELAYTEYVLKEWHKVRQGYFFSVMITFFWQQEQEIRRFAQKVGVKEIKKHNSIAEYYEGLGEHYEWHNKLVKNTIFYQSI